MAYGTVVVDSVTTSTPGGVLGAGNASTMKNRLINGAMVIDQRNAGASVTPASGVVYTLDRWSAISSQSSKFTVQQNAGSVTPPAGFTNYLGVTSTSAYAIGAGDYFAITQIIEGYNTADLGWGTANAKTVTLSFWVYSSLTGTFGGVFQNAAATRSYPFTYSISSANTWTNINLTIAGDTSGTWNTGNTAGVTVSFGLGVGSTYSGTAGTWAGTNYASATGAVSVVGTSGATFYITGVQLEVGSVATGFEYRQYGTELLLCQRYYEQWDNNGVIPTGYCYGNADFNFTYQFAVKKRAAPTVTASSATWTCYVAGSGHTMTSVNSNNIGTLTANISSTTSGVSGGQAGSASAPGAAPYVLASAEL